MKINITVSNLNNAVRFYSALFGVRPSQLGVGHATYQMADHLFSLHEGQSEPIQIHPYQVSESEFIPTYTRIRSMIKSICTLECELLDDTIRVTDPDGRVWVVSKTPLSASELETFRFSNKCYLEPIFFN